MSSLRTLVRRVKTSSFEAAPRYLVSLHVKPGVSRDREGISAVSPSHVSINVSSRAEDGAANKAVETLLARMLSLPKSHVKLVKGLTSREKVAEVSILIRDDEKDQTGWIREMLEGAIMVARSEKKNASGRQDI